MSFTSVLNQNTELQSLSVYDTLVMEKIEKIAAFVTSHGYPCKPFTQKALRKFLVLPEDNKKLISQRLEILMGILDIENSGSLEKDGIQFVQQALRFFKLHVKDDLWNMVSPDHVIELYNCEHLQLFRTFNFFKYSAYSLLDLLVNEWYHLWERPSAVITALAEGAQGIFSGTRTGIQTTEHIPEHIFKEIYNAEDVENFLSRSVLCKFGLACPVYDANDVVQGFLITARVKVLAYGEEVHKVSFI